MENFLSKSRVCNSTNNNSIKVLWPLCTCSAYILTMVQVSNHYLENCRRSSGDTNSTLKCDGQIQWQTDGQMYEGGYNCPLPLNIVEIFKKALA